jgi:hypothetical protein
MLLVVLFGGRKSEHAAELAEELDYQLRQTARELKARGIRADPDRLRRMILQDEDPSASGCLCLPLSLPPSLFPPPPLPPPLSVIHSVFACLSLCTSICFVM